MRLLTLSLIFTILISCKKDTTATTDITTYEWSMISFSDGKKKRITKKDHQYHLSFSNDSTFFMPTSVNGAGGKYDIDSKGAITLTYSTITEVCCENDTDERLLKLLPKITSYKVLGEILYFENNTEYIKFKRQ